MKNVREISGKYYNTNSNNSTLDNNEYHILKFSTPYKFGFAIFFHIRGFIAKNWLYIYYSKHYSLHYYYPWHYFALSYLSKTITILSDCKIKTGRSNYLFVIYKSK